MSDFLYLDDFLIDYDKSDPHVTINCSGPTWLHLYHLCKKSYYGGLPRVGDEVYTLKGGYGCSGAGVSRVVVQEDQKYLYISTSDSTYDVLGDRNRRYIVDKEKYYYEIINKSLTDRDWETDPAKGN